jgi:hypothetical protein
LTNSGQANVFDQYGRAAVLEFEDALFRNKVDRYGRAAVLELEDAFFAPHTGSGSPQVGPRRDRARGSGWRRLDA